MVQVVPASVSPEKIQEAMQWMNSDLAGDLAGRRQWRMVQGFAPDGKQDQVIMAKEPLLADAFDDMHIRKICFQYGTSPQRLIKMIRTEGKSSNEAANIEGLLPWFKFVKASHDFLIQRVLGYYDYEWVGDPFQEADPNKEAERLGNLVGKALMKPEEGRETLGLEPSGDPHADKLGVITGQGFVPLSDGVDLMASQAEKNRMPPAPPKTDGPPKPNGAAKAFEGISREEAVRVVNYLVKVASDPAEKGYGEIH